MSKHARGSADQWQALIEQQQHGCLSAPELCNTHNIGYASFCQWRKHLRKTVPMANESSLPAFLAVEPPPQPPSSRQWWWSSRLVPI